MEDATKSRAERLDPGGEFRAKVALLEPLVGSSLARSFLRRLGVDQKVIEEGAASTAARRLSSRSTPITRSFKRVADLSWRIARQEGFTAEARPGYVKGILIDVAELWELFLLEAVRRAFPDYGVEHAGEVKAPTFALTNADQAGMGRLKPDILVPDNMASS